MSERALWVWGDKSVKSQVCRRTWACASERQQGGYRLGQNKGWREELERGEFLRGEVGEGHAGS